jgi:uncharacterized tellurite resistance protein B-like protein
MLPFRYDSTARLREAALQMGVHKLRDGTWFQKVVAAHVKQHAENPSHWDERYPGVSADERARRTIARASHKAVATGMAAALCASAGELASFLTEGMAAPVGVPMTAGAMALETAYTALLQIDLACDLAEIYGVPFNADDVAEIATLFGLALGVDVEHGHEPHHHVEDDKALKGLTAKLVHLEGSEAASHIGRKLLAESAMKNIVPIFGVGISARWNYVATRHLGATVRRYVRYRAALLSAATNLKLANAPDPTFLVEGAWLLATADGEAAHEERLAVGAILCLLSDHAPEPAALAAVHAAEQERWFADMPRHVPPEKQPAFLDVLYLVAAADKILHEAERRFLKRVGSVLGIAIDFPRIEQMCLCLSRGQKLPRELFQA